jgi:hypothetical protein
VRCKAALLLPCLPLLAGCGDNVEQVRAANAAAAAIPAGLYSNVARDPQSGDLGGYEVLLAGGSDSATIAFVRCQQTCPDPAVVPVRRGMNGLFFEVPADGGTVPVALERTASGVAVNVDWGSGLETATLRPVSRKWNERDLRSR